MRHERAFPAGRIAQEKYLENTLKIWREEKMPELKLKTPWYGYPFGPVGPRRRPARGSRRAWRLFSIQASERKSLKWPNDRRATKPGCNKRIFRFSTGTESK